jgi:hypothetical protein
VVGVLEQLKRGNVAERHQALRDFEGLLRSRQPAASWSVATCAVEAAKTGIADGQWARAWAILSLALKSEPDDRQLRYLAQIFARAQPSAPALTMNQ